MSFTRSVYLIRVLHALLLALAGVFVLTTPHKLAAQNAVTVTAEQTSLVTYGSSISFSVRGSSTDAATDALLHISFLDGSVTDVRPAAFSGGQNFTASVSVPVSALHLPAFAQLGYQWEIFTPSGNARTELKSLLYDDTTVPWSWHVETQGNIFVHSADTDTTLSPIAFATINDMSGRLSEVTGANLASPIHIYIYPELSSLAGSLRRNQQRVQDWVAAYAVPEQGGIFVAHGTGDDAVLNLQRDLAHELSHLYVYSAAGGDISRIPGWLNEGLALNASSTPDTSLNKELNLAIHDGVLLSLNDLCIPSFTALPPHDAALGYAQSASFVRYIEKRYGSSQIKALIAAYSGGASCVDGVTLVLGNSLSELETQWHGDLGQSYVEPAIQDFSLLPWFAAWIVSLVLAYLFVLPQAPAHEGSPAYLTRHAVPPVSDADQS